VLARARANGWTVTPVFYRRVAYVSLASLVLIVYTGAGVRLTGSGLGCPDWPKCFGSAVAPLETHAWIEYGNRLWSGLVSVAAIASGVLAWRRRPFRVELAIFGALLPIGVVMQAALGALTVVYDLKPGFVMAHYVLSMVLLDAAFALAWCSRFEPGERRKSTDRLGVWAVRALLPLGSLTIMVGTAATAAGPHAGGKGTGDVINRLDFKGTDTLDWIIGRHSALAVALGLGALAVAALLARPGGDRRALPQLGVVLGLIAAQGIVGIVQYNNALPAELVWIHVALAVLTWMSLLWSVAVAGQLLPRPSAVRDDARDGPADRAVAGRALANR
jgi:cytochrome c oxidase assembly protein subunit 15